MCALSRVSKSLHSATVPHLYKCLHIVMPREDILVGIRRFFGHHDEKSAASYLKMVRVLNFTAGYSERCTFANPRTQNGTGKLAGALVSA